MTLYAGHATSLTLDSTINSIKILTYFKLLEKLGIDLLCFLEAFSANFAVRVFNLFPVTEIAQSSLLFVFSNSRSLSIFLFTDSNRESI